jgi:hypothetical protein
VKREGGNPMILFKILIKRSNRAISTHFTPFR